MYRTAGIGLVFREHNAGPTLSSPGIADGDACCGTSRLAPKPRHVILNMQINQGTGTSICLALHGARYKAENPVFRQ